MDPATLIGLLVVLIGLIVAVFLEGGNPVGFINLPAFFIVVVGTAGVTLMSVRFRGFMAIPTLIVKGLKAERGMDAADVVAALVRLAERARRDGLLAIEEELAAVPDPFVRKGLQMVVDGTDPEVVRDVLEADTDGMAERHKRGYSLFAIAGGFSPTLGIIGTVMGLIHVLEQLSDPGKLGPAIAVAFIATLYGVGAANVFFLPMANKLKALSEEEVELRELAVEGILAIQAGDNPRIIGEKLASYLPPGRPSEEKQPRERRADAAGAPAEEPA